MLPASFSKRDIQQLINQFAAELLRTSNIPFEAADLAQLDGVALESASPKPKAAQTRYLRLKQIIGDPYADPPVPPILPISKSAWYAGIKLGRYPAGIKISPRTVVWPTDAVFAIAATKQVGGCHEA